MYIVDNEGNTGFHEACFSGNLNVVQFLVQQGFDMNHGDDKGNTGFHWACSSGNVYAVDYLLEKGLILKCEIVVDNDEKKRFPHTCIEEKYFKIAQFLLEQGFDMNLGNNQECTGFHAACFSGNLNIVQFLLEQGFDMNLSEHKMTGFQMSCFSGNLNVVQFLLEQGLDITQGDIDRNTGFHVACFGGNLNVVQFFLEQGFDMNFSNDNGGTGFHAACFRGNLNVVQFLLEEGFDMNLSNNNGGTGFTAACFAGNLEVLQFLLQQGFKGINKRVGPFDGISCLNVLISDRHDHANDELSMPCILLLIEAGAELNKNYVFEELIPVIQNRIIEIMFVKEIIFEKWTERIAKVITDFTMDPFTSKSLQNLSQFLD
jgi:ankyrin repeat protein